MQFSDTSNKNGLLQLCEHLLNKGDTGITANATLKAQITAFINQAYHKVAIWILTVDRRFKWDDSNYTDFPIATTTFVNNQRDYTLPTAVAGGNASTLLKLSRVRAKDSNGTFYDCTLMGPEEEEYTTANRPDKFRIIGNSIRFQYPVDTATVTASNGLQFEFQRTFDEFVVGDTTQQPGFIASFHAILAYDAAATYAEGMGDFARSDRFRVRVNEIRQDLLTHYSHRIDLDIQPYRLIPRGNVPKR